MTTHAQVGHRMGIGLGIGKILRVSLPIRSKVSARYAVSHARRGLIGPSGELPGEA